MNSLTVIPALFGMSRMLWGVVRAGVTPKVAVVATVKTSNEAGHSVATSGSLSPDEIAGRAYELYLARGAQPGRDLDDWLQAERELYFPALQG